MSEPVTEQDRETVVEALAEALYEEWLGPIEDDSADPDTWDDIGEVERNCFRRMARYVVNRNAAARQAAEQRAERLEREVRAWRDYHRLQFTPYRNRQPGYMEALSAARCERNAARAANEALEREAAARGEQK